MHWENKPEAFNVKKKSVTMRTNGGENTFGEIAMNFTLIFRIPISIIEV